MVTLYSTISLHHNLNVVITAFHYENSSDISFSYIDAQDLSVALSTPWTFIDIMEWRNGPIAFHLDGSHRRANSFITFEQRPAQIQINSTLSLYE